MLVSYTLYNNFMTWIILFNKRASDNNNWGGGQKSESLYTDFVIFDISF